MSDMPGAGDIIIAITGIKGSGKSTFVQHFTQKRLLSDYATEDVTAHLCSLAVVPRFFLLDTPGYIDDPSSSVQLIAGFLSELCAQGARLSGMIHLYNVQEGIRFFTSNSSFVSHVWTNENISEVWMDKSLSRLVYATTFWDATGSEKGGLREKLIKERLSSDINQEGRAHGQDFGKQSASEILLDFIGRHHPKALQIPNETLASVRVLEDTAARESLSEEIEAIKRRHEALLNKVLDDHQIALHEQDARHKAELEKQKKEHEEVIAKLTSTITDLKRNKDPVPHTSNEYGSSTISGQAKAILGSDHRTYIQTFHVSHATFMYNEPKQEVLRQRKTRYDL